MRRMGFTLIELLVVIVIVGILASMSIVRTRKVTREAQLATLRTDLRALTIEEEFYNQRTLHYGALEDLDDFHSSRAVSVEITHLENLAFAATAVHAGLPGVTCGVFRGVVPEGVAGPAVVEGRITCE